MQELKAIVERYNQVLVATELANTLTKEIIIQLVQLVTKLEKEVPGNESTSDGDVQNIVRND